MILNSLWKIIQIGILRPCKFKFNSLTVCHFMKVVPQKLEIITHSMSENLQTSQLMPPETVKGMTVLNKNAFKIVTSVPIVTIHNDNISKVIKLLKKYLLKLKNFDSVVLHSENNNLRNLILNPELISSDNSFKDIIEDNDFIVYDALSKIDVTIEYENWSVNQILRSVLPDNLKVCCSYSLIGHIIHLNLREEYSPYKYLIGQVYLEKTKGIKIVVNKADIIDNSDSTFRTFNMEILASTDEQNCMVTTVKENGCFFTFDFSKVYWNPRLGSEHERIVKKLEKGDVLYDVMAGVGPFSIPAAKKGCVVFANDLNVHSFNALKMNATKNKVLNFTACNLDGKEFITGILKDHLFQKLNDNFFTSKIHILMNLPSLALEFLPNFIGLFSNTKFGKFDNLSDDFKNVLPMMHVYFFSYNIEKELAIHAVANKLGFCKENIKYVSEEKDINIDLIKNNIQPIFLRYVSEVFMVRRVATAKVMMRVSFYLPKEVLCNSLECDSAENPLCKKQKVS